MFTIAAGPPRWAGRAVALPLGEHRFIGENESGLVVQRFGPPLPPGRIIAIDGEAGFQARMLSPGLALPAVAVELQV